MKTNLLLLFVAIVMASCAADNISENTIPAESQLTLERVVTYNPSKRVYDSITQTTGATKMVQYFQNGLIVADSTYNSTHELESTTVRTYSATAASAIIYNVDHTPIHTSLFSYDNAGRITELSVSSADTNYRKTMSYAADNSCTVTNHYIENDNSEVWGTFNSNADGLLYARNSPNEVEMLVFEDGTPVTYKQAILDSNTLINMEYYDVPVPANRLKTVIQINNITLTGRLVESVAQNCTYYLKSLEGIYNYDSTFNELNYITHNMNYDLINLGTTETFYYYNE